MLINSDWIFILDATDELNAMILSSKQAEELRKAHHAVYSNEQLTSQIREFDKMKEHYEDVQRFGKYHPDYNIIMKKIREMKRAIDLNETIAALKMAENDFQDLLDQVGLIVGKSVSEAVKVPVSNPFFSTAGGGSCGTSCGTGGGCSCSA
jgi:cell fate (sporulation/competence/biofilm development) regulator YlbF (YheA/YmcA/DUF963 family)